eukprot:340575-Chlamydomonas_euryale.AAC.1
MASVVPLPFLKPFWDSWSLGSICSPVRCNKRAVYTFPALERRLIPPGTTPTRHWGLCLCTMGQSEQSSTLWVQCPTHMQSV